MGRFLLTVTLAGTAFFVGYQLLAPRRPQRAGFAAMRRKMMERMMDAMPENSPPKLVTTILPRLQKQNEQTLVLLNEQNELLRKVLLKDQAGSRQR